jgi:hypothetical protein
MAISIIVSIIEDVSIPGTETAALANELRAARAQPPAAKPTAPASLAPNSDPAEPRRFAGKSREDIMEMYLHLEKHDGRLANENGQMQRALQELLVDKRARDLAANGGTKAPTKVEATDLLQHPTEALDPFIEERVSRAISPIQQQLARLEGMLGQTVFNNNHRDAQEVINSEEFAAWTRETPLRRNIAQMAANGNTQAADDLLSEFKKTKAHRAEVETNEEQERLARAGSVSLEQSRTGNDGTATRQQGKVYTRSQMRALMQSASYAADESLREEVSRAYIEGRVKGQ